MRLPFTTLIVAIFLPDVFGKYLWDQSGSYKPTNNLTPKPKQSLYIVILGNIKKHHPTSFEDDKSGDYSGETIGNNKPDIGFKDLTPYAKHILRQHDCGSVEGSEHSWGLNETAKALLVQEQHKQRRKEVIKFMNTHMLSTKYFHEEMKRIISQRNVKDELRVMVEYLEHRDNAAVKKRILQIYRQDKAEKEKKSKQANVWRHGVNKITHHVVMDPNDYDENI